MDEERIKFNWDRLDRAVVLALELTAGLTPENCPRGFETLEYWHEDSGGTVTELCALKYNEKTKAHIPTEVATFWSADGSCLEEVIKFASQDVMVRAGYLLFVTHRRLKSDEYASEKIRNLYELMETHGYNELDKEWYPYKQQGEVI